MSERMRQAVGTILGAGFQVESDAFKTLVEIGGGATLDKLVEEVLKMANAAAPRPMSISRDLVLKAAEQLDLSSKSLFSETGLGGPRRFAQEVSSRLEVVSDPSGKLGTTGAFDDFLHYFRSRFEKMSKMFGQRMDTSRHGTIAEALQGGANGRARFICMVVEKREKTDQDRGRVFLTVDDYEDEATVLVTDQTPELYQTARKIIRDQVVYLETRKSSGELLVAEKIVLPEIPEHRPHLSDEEVYAALISDVHVGSKVFLEDAFRRVLAWLKGDWGVSYEREIADRVKYVIICGDLVDGIGVYPRQEIDLAITDIYEQYRVAARLVAEIPEHMEVVLIPGNHDAVRQALPQPMIPRDFAGPVYDARRVVSLGDPAELRLHGVNFLLYHGTSLMDIISSVPGMDYQRPQEMMEYQLRMRHLAPEYGKQTPIGPEQEDFLVVDRVPDVFQSGHIHVPGTSVYRGTTIVNSGAWQGQTEYQKRTGLVPKPGLLPVVNLSSLEVRMMNFNSP
ncbi:DNA-directed DNA polymerase II small subunit [Candidatus Bathyarchaeota archaeon]|nr:MAG: DNA-directed DNA polymerase II small subunit [Candidatus Bathyarchaeota archaeon]TMI31204.1 MAG: DNA-directed DNA polymerase II small subunit [Candidatus Bathyarchaeota archaeon]